MIWNSHEQSANLIQHTYSYTLGTDSFCEERTPRHDWYKWPHFVLPLTHRNPSTFLSLIQAPTVETPRTRTCGCWVDMFVDFLFVAPFDDDAHPKQTGQLTRMGSASNWLPWVVLSCIIRFPKGSRLKGSLTCGSILCRASPAWANQDNCTLSNQQLSRIISVPV